MSAEHRLEIAAAVVELYGYNPGDFHIVDHSLVCGPRFNIGIAILGKFSDAFLIDETVLRAVQGHHAEAGWLAQFLAHDDGWRWLVLDLEGIALQRAGKPSQSHRDGRIFRLRDFSVGLLVAADEATLTELPAPYVLAMRRRQSGAWEPFRGLRERARRTDAA
jgi:hypothetical protein